MMGLIREIKENSCILAEASVIEKLRHSEGIDLQPRLENALLVYDVAGRKSLQDVYKAYVEVVYNAGLPIIVSSPTWRANRQRTLEVTAAKGINRDAIRFLKTIRNEYDTFSPKIFIGGLIGCKNDCYKPEEALQTDEAYTFHSWQIGKLANEGVDYLMAATVPALSEAVGIARAMGKTKIPYFSSST